MFVFFLLTKRGEYELNLPYALRLKLNELKNVIENEKNMEENKEMKDEKIQSVFVKHENEMINGCVAILEVTFDLLIQSMVRFMQTDHFTNVAKMVKQMSGNVNVNDISQQTPTNTTVTSPKI